MAEADPPKPHPLEGVEPDRCHELLMAERNMLVCAKAERENESVRTIIQVSSAAIFLIPALITSRDVAIPRFYDAKLFYTGLIFISISMIVSILEQNFSALAYGRQIDVVFKYYTKESEQQSDQKSHNLVRRTRSAALMFFVFGMLMASIGTSLII